MSKSTKGVSDSETNSQISETNSAGAHKKAISKESAVSSQESINQEEKVTTLMDTNIHNLDTNTVEETSLQEDDLFNFSEVELGCQMCLLYLDSLSETNETEQNMSSETRFQRMETIIPSPSQVEQSEEEIINTFSDENKSHMLNETYIIYKSDDQNSSTNTYLGFLTEECPHSINSNTINEKIEGKTLNFSCNENISKISGIKNISYENRDTISEISLPISINSIQSIDKESSYQESENISAIYDITKINESSLSIFEAGFIRSGYSLLSMTESENFEVESKSSWDETRIFALDENRNNSEYNSLIAGSTNEHSEDPKSRCHDLVSCSYSIPESDGHGTEIEILSKENCSKTARKNNLVEPIDVQQASHSFQDAQVESNTSSENLDIEKICNRSIHVRRRRNLVSRMRRGIGKTVHRMLGKGTNRTVQQRINKVRKTTKRHSISNFINIVRDPRLPRTFSRQFKNKFTQDDDTSSEE